MYNEQYISAIRDYMVSNHQTLCVAESVTSGHLQASISLASEASKFFQGGITAYNLGQKARHLHVNPIHATSCNSVSEQVAAEMALNAIKLFSSDWSLSITGYASPLPEMGITDLFAFYAIAYHDRILHQGKVRSETESPLNVQLNYTNHLLKELTGCLSKQLIIEKSVKRV
jgi:PncC family amidohydrolase